MLTAAVLVADLERPERFFYILTRPNWTSWMTRGAFILTAHGAIASLWVLGYLLGWKTGLSALAPLALVVAFAATAYTGLLFAQGLARDLWQGPHATLDLLAQATIEGSAALLLAATISGGDGSTIAILGWTLAFASLMHLLILTLENLLTPSATLNHELAVRAIRHGAYRRLFWIGALGLGGVAPVLLAAIAGGSLPVLAAAAVVALAGGLAWEYIWVEAGQAVPNS
jgi:formate-dependent nitrite reductase membrane component NrfD